jgi:signal transduction histidine kinase
MEAVARYASEIAFTCEKLLDDVQRDGQEWLPSVGESARRQGELLLDEVNRATGFLKQLSVYGKEQVNAPELVDVKKVLRDLEPVLKRVAGGNIELVLPKASTPHNLDVEQERVERILVNVAAYGRERMRTGGRLMIEVASVVVDRNFVAKYPNVRPGGHVLLTVTEKNGASHPEGQLPLNGQPDAANHASNGRPGIDLGALQALIDNCGGHLWMTAEPPGDMVLKIHLPRRVLDDGRPAKASGRSRWISKLPGIRH